MSAPACCCCKQPAGTLPSRRRKAGAAGLPLAAIIPQPLPGLVRVGGPAGLRLRASIRHVSIRKCPFLDGLLDVGSHPLQEWRELHENQADRSDAVIRGGSKQAFGEEIEFGTRLESWEKCPTKRVQCKLSSRWSTKIAISLQDSLYLVYFGKCTFFSLTSSYLQTSHSTTLTLLSHSFHSRLAFSKTQPPSPSPPFPPDSHQGQASHHTDVTPCRRH